MQETTKKHIDSVAFWLAVLAQLCIEGRRGYICGAVRVALAEHGVLKHLNGDPFAVTPEYTAAHAYAMKKLQWYRPMCMEDNENSWFNYSDEAGRMRQWIINDHIAQLQLKDAAHG